MKLSERSKSKIAAKFNKAVKEIDTGKTVETKGSIKSESAGVVKNISMGASDEPAGIQMMTVDPEQLKQLMSSPEAEQIINMIADGVCDDLEDELDSIIKFYKTFTGKDIDISTLEFPWFFTHNDIVNILDRTVHFAIDHSRILDKSIVEGTKLVFNNYLLYLTKLIGTARSDVEWIEGDAVRDLIEKLMSLSGSIDYYLEIEYTVKDAIKNKDFDSAADQKTLEKDLKTTRAVLKSLISECIMIVETCEEQLESNIKSRAKEKNKD